MTDESLSQVVKYWRSGFVAGPTYWPKWSVFDGNELTINYLFSKIAFHTFNKDTDEV